VRTSAELTAAEPTAGRLRELGEHRAPDRRVGSTFPAVDEPPVGVDEDEVRLVRGAESLRTRAIRVAELRPRPSVSLDERFRVVRGVGDIQPEVRDLGVALDEFCVGDRLALARASPRRPDVDEHRSPSEVGERDDCSVE
jgi:hypothetical protein